MLSTLNVSQTGMNAARIAVENVSNNIANENTVGYKKRVVQVSELAQSDGRFTGRGVDSSAAYRITSQYMYDKIMSENTKANYYDKVSNMIGSVESIFSETKDSGFSADLNRYFQAIENLRTNPNSEIYKSVLKSSGSIVVESLQNLYTSIEQQQLSEKTELKVNVNKVNGLLKEIGDINVKLEKYEFNNDLLDKRDQLELELSNYVDISVNRAGGYYELKVAGEMAISNNTNVRTFDVIESKTNQVDKFYNQKFDSKGNFEIIDPLKFEADNTTPKTYTDGDKITYKLNNAVEVSITIGEKIRDTTKPEDPITGYPFLDINGDGNFEISEDELVRALVFKINNSEETKGLVSAYNGDYLVDAAGKRTTNDNADQYLRIESKFPGTENQFEGRLSVEKNIVPPNTPEDRVGEVLFRNENVSKNPQTDVTITINEKEISLKSGIMKAQVDNLSSSLGANKFQVYLDKLDSFAKTLSDVSDKFMKVGSNEYIYGDAASDASNGIVENIGLFTGLNVKDLKFNKSAVNDLNQEKLDYLATIQWKKDISFDGIGQKNSNPSKSTSLLDFFRDLKVGISSDKESNDFLQETQNNVKQSIKSSYEQLTRVDKDEEMLNLMKFQAAYTANAKIVTTINEMIQTLLGLKR